MRTRRWPFARSIKGDLLAGTAFFVVALGTVLVGGTHSALGTLLREEMQKRGTAIGALAANASREMLLNADTYALHQILVDLQAQNEDVAYIYLLSANGKVAAHSFLNGFPRGLAALRAGLEPRATLHIRTPERGAIREISVPVLDGELGSLQVGMSEERLRERLSRLVFIWVLAAAALLIVKLIAGFWLTLRFSNRVDGLIGKVERIGRGDDGPPADESGSDEISSLAKAFNRTSTQLRETRRDLIHAGKLAAVGELASGVAHEINNTLNTIGVCAQALQERAENPALRAAAGFEDFPEYLGAIREEIERCRKITANLLDFARQDAPERRLVDLNDLARGAVPLSALHLGTKEEAIALKLARDPLPVRGDPSQLHQAIVNLYLNALDSSPPGERVVVSSRRVNGNAVISVQDRGPGVAPEHAERIFDPFFTTKPAGKGTGLGLSICRRIAQSHGGTISMVNHPAGGAVFEMTLPVDVEPGG